VSRYRRRPSGHKDATAIVWSRVQRSDDPLACWLYAGPLNRDGYGQFTHRKRSTLAHRVAWEERHGPIPAGSVLMHLCDVPNCVRPEHLRVGTPAENVADKVAKGRHARGERMAAARLTEDAVREIRRAYRPQSRPGLGDGNVKQLAQRYGVKWDTVLKVVRRALWRHVA
jgi:hypothetical protein